MNPADLAQIRLARSLRLRRVQQCACGRPARRAPKVKSFGWAATPQVSQQRRGGGGGDGVGGGGDGGSGGGDHTAGEEPPPDSRQQALMLPELTGPAHCEDTGAMAWSPRRRVGAAAAPQPRRLPTRLRRQLPRMSERQRSWLRADEAAHGALLQQMYVPPGGLPRQMLPPLSSGGGGGGGGGGLSRDGRGAAGSAAAAAGGAAPDADSGVPAGLGLVPTPSASPAPLVLEMDAGYRLEPRQLGVGPLPPLPSPFAINKW